MFSRWPIRNKLVTGLVLLLVIVAALSWSGFHGLYAYRALVKSLGWRMSELPLASELSQRVSDLRVSLHGGGAPDLPTLGAGDPAPLDPPFVREQFRMHLDAVHEALHKYRVQLLENQQHGTRFSDSKHEWEKVREIERTLDRITTAENSDRWLYDRLAREELSNEVEQLQDSAGDLPGSLLRNIRDFTTDVRLQYRTLIILTWITSISGVALLVLFVHLFYRWVFRPLRILIKGSRKVAGGTFSHRITLDTHDEMAELAEAMNDMTARFQAIRDDLDRQVQERTKQVVRSEQLASVGFLAAGVAHEINNPLASIAMCAESLESRMQAVESASDRDRDVIRDYLQMIQTEAFRCKEITEKLLDFSRMGEVRRQPTELRELVQSVIDMLVHFGRYQEKIVRLVAGPPVLALVNPQQIKQVVLNLLTNGLDSVDQGGSVEIELGERDGHAELLMTDNGCGMTPEVLEHLFEPFFTRRRGGQGIGLGLSITYRIIADHDGHIEANSEGPGKGSRFRVELPLVRAQKELDHRIQAA